MISAKKVLTKILQSIKGFSDTIGTTSLPTSAQTLTGAIAETYRRTRNNYAKGTHNITELRGVYGVTAANSYVTLYIPINLRNDVTGASFTAIKLSIRNTDGSYIIGQTVEQASYVTEVNVYGWQPLIQVRLKNTGFTFTPRTPVVGEITDATLVLT